MILDYNLIWENLPLYFNGALLTLKVLLISLALGLVSVSYTHLTLPTNREV